MAGLLGGILGGEEEKPEVEAPEALAGAEAFSFQKNPERFMTFRKSVIFVVVDESAHVLVRVDAP